MSPFRAALLALSVAALASCGGADPDPGIVVDGGGGNPGDADGGTDAGGGGTDAGDAGGGGTDAGDAGGGGTDAGDAGGGGTDAGDAGGGTDAGDSGVADAGSDAGVVDAGPVLLPDGGQPIAASQLCVDSARRLCDFAIRCGRPGFGVSLDGGADTVGTFTAAASERAECEAAAGRDLLGLGLDCEVLVAGFDAGRATIDGVAYDRCISTLAPEGTCNRDLNQAASCLKLDFLLPRTDAGSLCYFDKDCKGGYCTGDGMACGTCQPYAATNAACTRDSMCNPATNYCNNQGAAAGTCRANTGDGQFCFQSGNIELALEECGPVRQCQIVSGILPTCSAGRALGASCRIGSLQCYRSQRGLESLCLTDGGTSQNGVCAALFAESGGPCEIGEPLPAGAGALPGPFCPDEEQCVNKRCVPRVDAGVSCGNSSQCRPGSLCDAGQCHFGRIIGENCTATSDCQEGLRCGGGGTCVAAAASTGEDCDGGVVCARGFCNGAGQCEAPQADGVACDAGVQCASGVCIGNCIDACWD